MSSMPRPPREPEPAVDPSEDEDLPVDEDDDLDTGGPDALDEITLGDGPAAQPAKH